jgi:quercetin dioxygenase-like cupin family protein
MKTKTRVPVVLSSRTLATLLALLVAPAVVAGAAKPEALSFNAPDLKWGPAPPDLPSGAEIAVLHGDPTKKAPFTVRFKLPTGYKIPPHWHSKDEQLTILSGTFVLHMGDTMDAPGSALTAGGYHFLPGKMHHAAEAQGETILQLDGVGPFDIHYLNPADKPAPPAAKKP